LPVLGVLAGAPVAAQTITTVAGSGIQGFCGDGGPATSAKLSYPWGIALDTAGNLFISDRNNARVRKVAAATGIIPRSRCPTARRQ
jgi:DNA-binding beta-propeller fold protein YncE